MLSPSLYSLTVQHHGLKHHTFMSLAEDGIQSPSQCSLTAHHRNLKAPSLCIAGGIVGVARCIWSQTWAAGRNPRAPCTPRTLCMTCRPRRTPVPSGTRRSGSRRKRKINHHVKAQWVIGTGQVGQVEMERGEGEKQTKTEKSAPHLGIIIYRNLIGRGGRRGRGWRVGRDSRSRRKRKVKQYD